MCIKKINLPVNIDGMILIGVAEKSHNMIRAKVKSVFKVFEQDNPFRRTGIVASIGSVNNCGYRELVWELGSWLVDLDETLVGCRLVDAVVVVVGHFFMC